MLVEDLHPSSLECPHEVFCGCVLNRQRHAVVRYCGWIIVDYFHLHLWLKALPAGAGVFAQEPRSTLSMDQFAAVSYSYVMSGGLQLLVQKATCRILPGCIKEGQEKRN